MNKDTVEPDTQQSVSSIEPSSEPSSIKNDHQNKKLSKIKILLLGLAILLIVIIISLIFFHKSNENKSTNLSSKTTTSHKSNSLTSASGVPLSIDPINPTAIPLGDGRLSTSPKVGYVDSCITSFPSTGGATSDGPWINQTNKTWNKDSKIAVMGSVNWPNASYSVTLNGDSRIITGNDLPINHTTGTFPISISDPAYTYDQNPNTIKTQSINWTLNKDPSAAKTPSCTGGGAIGILNDGVLLFNALDGEGRDAGAHEILDSYQGHPDSGGMYHHHVVPTYMLGTSSDKSSSTLIGYAADGYGIYVERDANGNLLTNSNLDSCHGRSSEVMWNGKMTYIYHYDATLEYPYTIGCFHGTPIKTNDNMSM